MKQRILDKVEEAFVIAEKFYGRTFSRPTNIIFKRSGTMGGYCWYAKKELMFQLDFAEHNPDKFDSTCFHEVAHWIDKEVYGYRHTDSGRRQIHGNTWKYIMSKVYRLSPDRCHTYDTSVTTTKKQDRKIYKCNCREHKISTTIHNRICRGHEYKCRSCGYRLIFDAKLSQMQELQAKIALLQKLVQ